MFNVCIIYKIVDDFKVDKNEKIFNMTQLGSGRVNPITRYPIEMGLDKKNLVPIVFGPGLGSVLNIWIWI